MMSIDQPPDQLEVLTEFLYLAPVGLMQFELNGAVTLANPLAAQLLMPFAPKSDLSDAYSALAPLVPDLARRVREYTNRSGLVLDHERCPIELDAHATVLSITVHRIHDRSNLAVIEDVTRLVKQERQLLEDQLRFRAIFDNVRDYAIYTIDPAGRVDGWNQSLQRSGGWRSEDVIGRSMAVFFPPEDHVAGQVEALLAGARQTGSIEVEGWRLRQDGSRLWANTVLTALPDAGGAVRGFVVVSRDMTERKRVEDELRRLATTDPLTGAFNRRHGQTCLAAAFQRTRDTALRPGVLMLDIDHFKSINDQHGHDAGDAALCAAVSACREVLDESIIVRWGGEEFLLILARTEAVAACGIAESLRAAIGSLRVDVGSVEIAMTVSIGVAIDHDDDSDSLIRRADKALYAAKRNGRNRVILAD